MSRLLEVLLHGKPIGRLVETGDGTEFHLADNYRKSRSRPVLGQKFEDDLWKTHKNRKRYQLPDFFANLIPEEGPLRRLIEKEGKLEAGDDLALLAFVGSDLPGAVTVRRGDSFVEKSGLPPRSAEESFSGKVLRFSLAGVQLKFSMLREGERLTLPGQNQSGEWIVKFDSPTFRNLAENEYSMLEWARAAGFDVPECYLHPIDHLVEVVRRHAPESEHVLAIRRYDREGDVRIHQEDFAQAVGLHPKQKYELITSEAMALLVRRFIDESAVDEFIRRLTFVVACGNNDAHLKNWSLVYPDRIRARWSPLYDQVATVAWKEPDRELALKTAGIKHFGKIDREAIKRFAEKSDIANHRALDLVEETLQHLRDAWKDIASDLPLPEKHISAIQEHWSKVPLLRDAGLGR